MSHKRVDQMAKAIFGPFATGPERFLAQYCVLADQFGTNQIAIHKIATGGRGKIPLAIALESINHALKFFQIFFFQITIV